MKKILLTLALGAFIGGASTTFAQDDTKKKSEFKGFAEGRAKFE